MFAFHIVSKNPCSTPLSVVIIPTFVMLVASTKTLTEVDSGEEASVENTINWKREAQYRVMNMIQTLMSHSFHILNRRAPHDQILTF